MGVSDHTKPTMKSMADMVVMGNLMSKVTRKVMQDLAFNCIIVTHLTYDMYSTLPSQK